MKQLGFKSDIITIIFATIVLTGIYINLRILMDQLHIIRTKNEINLAIKCYIIVNPGHRLLHYWTGKYFEQLNLNYKQW